MKRNEETKKKLGSIITTVLLHSLTGIILSLVLCFICSILVMSDVVSPDCIPVLSYSFVFLSSLLASLLSSRAIGKPIYIALLQGTFLSLILYLVGAVLFRRFAPSMPLFQTPAFCFAGAILGAVLSAFGTRRKR